MSMATGSDEVGRRVWVAFDADGTVVAQVVLIEDGQAITSGFAGDEDVRGGRGFWLPDRNEVLVFRFGGGALRILPRRGDRSEIRFFEGTDFDVGDAKVFRAQPAAAVASELAGVWMIQDPANRRLVYLELLADGTARDSTGARGRWRPNADGAQGVLGRKQFSLGITADSFRYREGGRSLVAIRVGDADFEISP